MELLSIVLEIELVFGASEYVSGSKSTSDPGLSLVD